MIYLSGISVICMICTRERATYDLHDMHTFMGGFSWFAGSIWYAVFSWFGGSVKIWILHVCLYHVWPGWVCMRRILHRLVRTWVNNVWPICTYLPGRICMICRICIISGISMVYLSGIILYVWSDWSVHMYVPGCGLYDSQDFCMIRRVCKSLIL